MMTPRAANAAGSIFSPYDSSLIATYGAADASTVVGRGPTA